MGISLQNIWNWFGYWDFLQNIMELVWLWCFPSKDMELVYGGFPSRYGTGCGYGVSFQKIWNWFGHGDRTL